MTSELTRYRRRSSGCEALSDFSQRTATSRAPEVLADHQQIALSDDEAVRFLDALDTVDQNTVAHLRELREHA
jgi:uncharacterized protein (DUF1778 family)